MAKSYKSHRANPVKQALAGAAVGPGRRQAKRVGRAELDAAAKQKAEQTAEKPGQAAEPPRPKEIGGPSGPEPTRYGDWEIGGRCIDF